MQGALGKMKEAFTGATVEDLKPVAAELSPEDPAGSRLPAKLEVGVRP